MDLIQVLDKQRSVRDENKKQVICYLIINLHLFVQSLQQLNRSRMQRPNFAEQEALYEEAQRMTSIILEKDRRIAQLEAQLYDARQRIVFLERENESLKKGQSDPKEEARQQGLQQKIMKAAKVKVWSDLEKQQKLFVGYSDFLELPTKLCLLAQLIVLDLGRNQLKFLPENIGALRELNVLSLYSNELTELPQGLGNLTKLEELYLHNNQLSSLPTWIGQLKFLKELTFSKNKITEIPESFQNLKQITYFSFDLHLISEKNIFKAKPITSFTKLNRLDLYYPNAEQQRIELIKKECKQRKITLWLNGSEQKL